MSRTIVIQNRWFKGDILKSKPRSPKKTFAGSGLVRRTSRVEKKVSGGAKISLISFCFALAAVIFLTGIFYLYQVNSLATKGFEIREIENKIKTGEKENKQLKIKEIELRSMYNIEKSTENLNLVNSPDITYLEIAGPMAMK